MRMANLLETKSSLDPMKTYLEAVLDFYATLNSLTAEQWALPTPCPGWSVADIVAHTIDLDSMAVGELTPVHEPAWDQLPHVKTPSHQFTERGSTNVGEHLLPHFLNKCSRRPTISPTSWARGPPR